MAEETKIQVPDDLHRQIERVAYEQGKSVGQIVREALAEYVVTRRPPPPAVPVEEPSAPIADQAALERNPLYQIIGIARSGIPDGAENHDYYLYMEQTP